MKTRLKKLISLALAFIIAASVLPLTVTANGDDTVYISVSHDGQFVSGGDGEPIAHLGVSLSELASVDLDTYGLSDYLYDADADGTHEITALHLYIYVHENIIGGDFSEVTVTGGAGSIYFANGLFGFEDENLRYNYNGAYPADENGWGFTADRIVLSAGDYFDVAHYTDWSFYMDSAYGFHYFVDGSDAITHAYTAEAGEELSLKLMLVGGGMGMGDTYIYEAGYTIYYGSSLGDADGSVTTDDSGAASVAFTGAGTYYVWCDGGYGAEYTEAIVSSPAVAKVTVAAAEAPEQPREAQDVSAVLDATMAQLAETVTAPAFGTNAGEWTVLSLARGEYYAKDNTYFTDYYDRIVETVNTTAASVNLNGALHKSKSTDNSRLIVALSALGKNATAVGDWNLITPYEDFDWIKKQGINGVIWALIALDSNNYQTADTTIRQQCIDFILEKQLADGGWTLSGTVADPDITGMTLQALYNYKDQTAVATAADEAITCLSEMQQESGGFLYGTSETSESAVQVIVALTTWGINPDTDSRFVKGEKSAVDALLAYYVEDEAMFEHQSGAGTNDMATDQACYALVAYDRFINGKTSLYDYSDVTFEVLPEYDGFTAILGIPSKVETNKKFNATVSVNEWDNEGGYKLIDLILYVPAGIAVTDLNVSNRLIGGSVSYNLEESSGKLRVVYFDANQNSDITVSGSSSPIELFTIGLMASDVTADTTVQFAITGMSVKLSSDSAESTSMIVIDTENTKATTEIVEGISFSTVCLYEGDGVDLIRANQKAIAVSVTGIEDTTAITYNDGENYVSFRYSSEMSEKTGVMTYVALVSKDIAMESFIDAKNYTVKESTPLSITFGDSNNDGLINAQDALAAVNAWLRKTETLYDGDILALNVNGDSRINTFDALGIVEAFVNQSEFTIVTKASALSTK